MPADSQRQAAAITPGSRPLPTSGTFVTDLDALSNSVIGLIEAGDFGAAEATCRRLLDEFSDQVDGIWRLAMVHQARGDRAAAARCYREAAEFMRSHHGFDPEGIADMIEAAQRMEAEPCAPLTGGPSTSASNSRAAEGPPSLS